MENQSTMTETTLHEDFTGSFHGTISIDDLNLEENPSLVPQCKVRVNLSLNIIATICISDHQDNTRQGEPLSEIYEGVLDFDAKQLMDPATMQEALATVLSGWPILVPEDIIQFITVEFLKSLECYSTKLRESTSLSSWEQNYPYRNLIFGTTWQQNYNICVNDLAEWQFLEEIPTDSDSDSDLELKPASDSSIKALKTTVVLDGSCCSVCLEDIPTGCQVLCMPCSHEFHPDCIREWLGTSHYCPYCRYEMPVEED